MIIQPPTQNPLSSIETQVRPDESTRGTVQGHDLRKVGLQSSGQSLSASRGDLDVVFEARAKADVMYCPVCPEPHPVA